MVYRPTLLISYLFALVPFFTVPPTRLFIESDRSGQVLMLLESSIDYVSIKEKQFEKHYNLFMTETNKIVVFSHQNDKNFIE